MPSPVPITLLANISVEEVKIGKLRVIPCR